MTEIMPQFDADLSILNGFQPSMNLDLEKDRFDSGYESCFEDNLRVVDSKPRARLNTEAVPIYPPGLTSEILGHLSHKLVCDGKFLLDRSAADRVSTKKVELKMKGIEYSYKNAMKEYFWVINEILKSKQETLQSIEKSGKRFRTLSRVTSNINLLSSASELMVITFSSLILRFWGYPRTLVILSTVAGSFSVFGSLFALSYAKHTTDSILKHIRQGKHGLKELESVHRKGNWIDEAVQDLFPHGIDQNVIDQSISEAGNNFESERSWKKFLCSIIILSNVQKNAKLLADADFLKTVKLFVDSPAAQIWWKRMEVSKLMDGVLSKSKTSVDDGLASANLIFQNRVAVSLLPSVIPLVVSPASPRTRMILGNLGALAASFSLAESDDKNFEELTKTVKALQKECDELKKIWMTINSEFD